MMLLVKVTCFFVVAAGNDGAPLEMMKVVPASYELDNLITIGSHDSEGGFSATTNMELESMHMHQVSKLLLQHLNIHTRLQVELLSPAV